MNSERMQYTAENVLVEGVDNAMKPYIVMPYSYIQEQHISYIVLVGIFIYNNTVLLARNTGDTWGVTIQSPLVYGYGKKELLENAMLDIYSIKGVHCHNKKILPPTFMQKYHLCIYTITVPYFLSIALNTQYTRFVDIALLKQSIVLEPKVFSPMLIKVMEYI